MDKVTSVKLGSYFDAFVAELTANGRYNNTSEALRAGLRLLERDEQQYQAKLERLRLMVVEGEESGESELSHDQIIAQAKELLKAELSDQ